jgi:hypothetical protein
MPFIYQPRRPRASPLWQILTAVWDAFLAGYEKCHRATMGEDAAEHGHAGLGGAIRAFAAAALEQGRAAGHTVGVGAEIVHPRVAGLGGLSRRCQAVASGPTCGTACWVRRRRPSRQAARPSRQPGPSNLANMAQITSDHSKQMKWLWRMNRR